MKNLFKEAHKLTKEMKREYPEVDYKAQFSICLSYLHEMKGDNKMKELQGTEKQIKWAEDIRKELVEKLEQVKEYKDEILNSREGTRREKMERSYNKLVARIEDTLENETSAKFYIEEIRNELTNKVSLAFAKQSRFTKAFVDLIREKYYDSLDK